MILLAFVPLLLLAAMLMVGYLVSGPRYTGPVSDHFDGRRFTNPENIKAKGFSEVMKWMLNRKPGPWKEQKDLPFGARPETLIHDGIRITFVNHSTFLIQADGLNFLTDPVWSMRTSPVEWAGPKRMRPPGIRLEDLPKIDVLLLSHNHWDHLDIESVTRIVSTHRPKIITPLGVKAFLDSKGVFGATDLDWWEEKNVGDLKVQAVPAQHFSGRGLFDRDATLWCGYVIKRPTGQIYFAGDTGYNPTTFNEIGNRCAPIALSLIPIGAFKPEWFMSPIHCSPQEAVMLHEDVRSRQTVASHFGTFPLADDGQFEPQEKLMHALKAKGLNPECFIVMQEGLYCHF
jgi:L-ascorbate metabolism protein UlaG (beta-lactamase superfamily)